MKFVHEFSLLIIIFVSTTNCSFSLNILVYSPVFGTSHMNFMAHLADTLAEAGHNVTVLAPVTNEGIRHRFGLIHTKNVIFVEQDLNMRKRMKPVNDNMTHLWLQQNLAETFAESFSWLVELTSLTCQMLVADQKVIGELKNVKWDLAILEPWAACPLGFFKSIRIDKTILASSTVQYEFLFEHSGEPFDMSYVPALLSDTNDKMDLYGRFKNWKYAHFMKQTMTQLFDKETQIYRKHLGNELPDWRELVNSASLYFTNSNPYIDFPRPIIQKTVAIGGISVDMERIKSQKLDDQWNQILNQRSRNMLISFGSMIQSAEMPLEWRSNILSVLKTMPNVTFIWKYESDDLLWAHGANNIYFSKWVPQTALLADPRVNAFLTHGGLGSTNELAHCGKPAVMVPVFSDQIRNANMLARHHSAIAVRKEKLNDFKIIKNAIHSILYDQSYQKNAENLADLLANQPLSAKESVVKHTEFVAKFGPFPNMDSHARNLNFFQRNLLDIYFLIGFSYFSFAVFIFSIVRFLYSKFSIQIIQKKNKIE